MSNTERSGDGHADEVGHGRDWREVREQIGLTLAELSAKLGAASQTVRRWETADREPALAYQRQMLSMLEDAEQEGDA